ncbi:MAG: methionine adenosyltransferase [Candidatus Njordarchaeales archaeon]
MSNFVFHPLRKDPVENLPVEIVERKGLGHPDTICDGVVERVAIYLTQYYSEHFGFPLHFNVDKAVLVGGRALPRFGGGEVLEPIIIHIVGRATTSVKRESGQEEAVPIGPLVLKAVHDYIGDNFRYLDPIQHIVVQYSIRPGSVDLVKVYEKIRKTGVPPANDTSIGVGFAPLTDTERICLEVEQFLNSPETKKKYPAVGEDIKVMCVRMHNKIRVTLAMATVSKEVNSMSEYLALKEQIREILLDRISNMTEREVELYVNMADDPENGIAYITVTGTSAEAGDDGQVGRGNRANGLITPMRPMSIEAAAGKNAVSHVGKIYQIAARTAAEKIYKEVGGLKEVYVMLVSTIGQPITEPQIVNIQYLPEEGVNKGDIEQDMKGIIEEVLNDLPNLWKHFIRGEIKVY